MLLTCFIVDTVLTSIFLPSFKTIIFFILNIIIHIHLLQEKNIRFNKYIFNVFTVKARLPQATLSSIYQYIIMYVYDCIIMYVYDCMNMYVYDCMNI